MSKHHGPPMGGDSQSRTLRVRILYLKNHDESQQNDSTRPENRQVNRSALNQSFSASVTQIYRHNFSNLAGFAAV